MRLVDIDDIQADIERLVQQRREIDQELEEMIGVTDTELSTALDPNTPVTDRLLPKETTTCWMCRTEVDVEQIEATVKRLREYCQQKSRNRTKSRKSLTN